MWKKHIISSIAGIFTLAQLVLIFIYSIEGIPVLRILGFILWLISVLFGFLPIFLLKQKGDVQKGKNYIHTQKLVTEGLYGIIRHPQYIAGPLLNVALMLISQHWLLIITGIPAVILMGFDIRHADAEGLEKFGEEYQIYMKEVPKVNFLAGMFRRFRK